MKLLRLSKEIMSEKKKKFFFFDKIAISKRKLYNNQIIYIYTK